MKLSQTKYITSIANKCLKRISKSNSFEVFFEKIFDPEYYLFEINKNLSQADAKKHYLEIGSFDLISPSPLFSPLWYAYIHGLEHINTTSLLKDYFLRSQKYSIDPHPLINTNKLIQDFKIPKTINAIDYFYEISKDVSNNFFLPSLYFWPEFYLNQNEDVKASKMNPFIHYIKYGWKENRNPSPYFHVKWYTRFYEDIHKAGIEPLQHFVSTGIFERRNPHYFIDIDYYLSGAPDVVAAHVDPYLHFIFNGDSEGRSAHPLFDPWFYKHNGDSSNNFPPLLHYITKGAQLRRSPCPGFDIDYYIFMYPDDADDVFFHFLSDKGCTKRHFHSLIDGLYQKHTSEKCAKDMNPLIDYIQFRSHFNFDDKIRSAVSTPSPKNVFPSFSFNNTKLNKDEPLVSIITPCYKSNQDYLVQCINSVISQSYLNWELILVDDGSPDKETWDFLVKQSNKDSRIKLVRLKINSGISLASNAGINCSKGSFLAFLDHDDVLAPDALLYCMSELISNDGDAIYSDQAYITPTGDVDQLFFKPDWSPALFTGVMYIGHFLVVKKDYAISCGLFNKRFDGCQDYEFMLRYSELSSRILHLPKILYYWRRAEGSVAANANAKGHIEKKQQIAVAEHFQRLNINSSPEIDIRVSHRLNVRPKISSKKQVIDIIVETKVPKDIILDFLVKIKSFNIKIRNADLYTFSLSLNFRQRSGFLLFINPF